MTTDPDPNRPLKFTVDESLPPPHDVKKGLGKNIPIGFRVYKRPHNTFEEWNGKEWVNGEDAFSI